MECSILKWRRFTVDYFCVLFMGDGVKLPYRRVVWWHVGRGGGGNSAKANDEVSRRISTKVILVYLQIELAVLILFMVFLSPVTAQILPRNSLL
jgi:hypothetical protein